jgi:hypothetical protein
MTVHGTKRQFARCKFIFGVGGKADQPVECPDFSTLTHIGSGSRVTNLATTPPETLSRPGRQKVADCRPYP